MTAPECWWHNTGLSINQSFWQWHAKYVLLQQLQPIRVSHFHCQCCCCCCCTTGNVCSTDTQLNASWGPVNSIVIYRWRHVAFSERSRDENNVNRCKKVVVAGVTEFLKYSTTKLLKIIVALDKVFGMPSTSYILLARRACMQLLIIDQT